MTGAEKTEFAPLLTPGLHKFDLAALKRLCVQRFPESITRPKIMGKLEEVIELILRTQIRGEVWIDGSFLTEKLNPDDTDIVLVIPEKELNNMTRQQRQFYTWFKNTSLYVNFRCDNYVFVNGTSQAEYEYLYAYWLKQFGFSRGNQMKGLAVVQVPFVVLP